jgi:hypothetical protein
MYKGTQLKRISYRQCFFLRKEVEKFSGIEGFLIILKPAIIASEKHLLYGVFRSAYMMQTHLMFYCEPRLYSIALNGIKAVG